MLVFDEHTHSYTWNGKPVPSVTRIIQAAGLHPFEKGIQRSRPDLVDGGYRSQVVAEQLQIQAEGLLRVRGEAALLHVFF